MKKIKKALALVLALAMIATVVPVASTEAASTAKLSATTATIAAGSKKVITLTTPSTWKKVKTSWKVGKKSVAQIVAVTKKASVRAQAAGETNVKVKVTYAKSTKKGAKRYSKSLYCKVTVKDYVLKNVTQTKYNTLEATVDGKTSDLKAADFKITNKANNNVAAIQSVAVDKADTKKVTITTFASLTDGATYVVTLGDDSKEVTVSDGTVADVNVTPVQIAANTEGTEIKGQTIDKNGVVISEFKVSEQKSPVELSLSTTQGYVNGDKLVLPVVGNKGTAEVKYHTYKYDEQAQEVGAISKKFDIVAIADTPVTTNAFEVSIGTKAPNWDKDTKNNQFSASDTTMKAYFRFKNSDNKEIENADYANYSVVSSDDSVLLLPKTQLTEDKSVFVKGIKAGSAYINVLDKDGKVLTSLPVVVTADRKLTNITLGSTSLVVAQNANASYSTIDTTVKSLDQYGAVYEDEDIKSISADVMNKATGAGDKNLVDATNGAKNKVVLNASGVKEGTYTVKVTVEAKDGTKINRTISVRVVKASITDPNEAKDLRLGLTATEVDLAIGADTTAENIEDKNINVSVDAYSDGAKIGTVAIKDVCVNGKSDFVSGSKINVTTNNGKVEKNFKAGTYTVTAALASNENKKFSGSFTIKDTQSDSIAIKVNSKDLGSCTTAADVVAANVEFSINGDKYAKVDSSRITDVDSKTSKDNKAIYVGTVKIAVPNKAGVTYDVPVVINTTFSK